MALVGPNFPGIPSECPTCASHGMHSAVKLYQVNMEEAAVFCENSSCPFPLFSQQMCPIVVPHKPSASTTSHPPLKKINPRSPDTLSLSSFGSVSSQYSHPSTISSITSDMATPTPPTAHNHVNRRSMWNANNYQATSLHLPMSGKNPFDWMSPESSIAASPACSLMSGTDSEIDNAMKDPLCVTPTFGLTPSPSPLLTDPNPRLNQQDDDIDAYIVQSLMFFGDGPVHQQGAPAVPRPVPVYAHPAIVNQPELNNFRELAEPPTVVDLTDNYHEGDPLNLMDEIAKQNSSSFLPSCSERVGDTQNADPEIGNKQPPRKRTNQTAGGSGGSPPPPKRTLESMPVWGNIELPSKYRPKRKTPTVPKKSKTTKPASSSQLNGDSNSVQVVSTVAEVPASNNERALVPSTDMGSTGPIQPIDSNTIQTVNNNTEDVVKCVSTPIEPNGESGIVQKSKEKSAPTKGRGRPRTKTVSAPKKTAAKPVTTPQRPPSRVSTTPVVTAPPTKETLVKVGTNDEGTTVFTILPGAPPPAPSPVKSVPKAAPGTSKTGSKLPNRGRPKQMVTTPVAKPKPAVKKKQESSFCLDSIVQKFIQSANNKKLPAA